MHEVVIDGQRYVPAARSAERRPGIALSILVPSVSSRRHTFAPKMIDQIFGMHEALSPTDRERVEILMLTDTKSMTTGDKRNRMLELAQGEYVAFVDDDDRLDPEYLIDILAAIDEHRPDVVTFQAMVSLAGAPPKACIYSLRYQRDANRAMRYERLPNHLCAVRAELARKVGFPAKQCGEDSDYASRLRPLLTTEHYIPKPLYFYDFDPATTETQKPAMAASRPEVAPAVDVVFLARSDSKAKIAMTRRAIETCIAGAGSSPVNVIVVEQVEGVAYDGATMIYQPGAFNYNAFANIGARAGSAPRIMIANNDLEFGSGWLAALLAIDHPVASPVSPSDRRQRNITAVETGDTNGRHFSGWCFMIRRSLWEKIGGFDEDFIFWCADDSVIEQVKQVGVMPVVVPTSKVWHLGSRSGGTANPALTWAMVHKFEQKYGKRKFENDPRYLRWKRSAGVA